MKTLKLSDEKTSLILVQPKFKIGDIITLKDREDCESADGQTKKYWFGVINYNSGKKASVTKIREYIPVKNCYAIEVNIEPAFHYLMLECEFQEYDAEKIETSETYVKVNCSNSLQRNFCFQQKGETYFSGS